MRNRSSGKPTLSYRHRCENVICVRPETDLDDVASIMQQKKVRHIPVCDEDGLHGMISIGDLNAFHASSQEAQIHFLSEYIYGRV